MVAKKKPAKKRAAKKPAPKRARKPKIVPANDDGPRVFPEAGVEIVGPDEDRRSPVWRLLNWLFPF